jgi:hypothetical protein
LGYFDSLFAPHPQQKNNTIDKSETVQTCAGAPCRFFDRLFSFLVSTVFIVPLLSVVGMHCLLPRALSASRWLHASVAAGGGPVVFRN